MAKFIYKNKKTGKKVYSNIMLNEPDLILVSQMRDMQIKSNDSKIIKK